MMRRLRDSEKSGKVCTVDDLAKEYGFTDINGRWIPPFRIPDEYLLVLLCRSFPLPLPERTGCEIEDKAGRVFGTREPGKEAMPIRIRDRE